MLLGAGDGTFGDYAFTSGEQLMRGLAVGDVNNDGTLDVVTTSASFSQVHVYIGKGDGTFQYPNDIILPDTNGAAESVVLGDFYGDGILDAVAADSDSDTVQVLVNAGDGNLGTPVEFFGGFRPNFLEVADLDGNGQADFVLADPIDESFNSGNTIQMYLSRCGGR